MEKSSKILAVLVLVIINILFWNWLSIAAEFIDFSLGINYENLSIFWQNITKALNGILMLFIITGFSAIGTMIEFVLFIIFRDNFNTILNLYVPENYKFELKDEE